MSNGLPHVAFLGLGTMGTPMAARLARAGYPMTVWNRTIEKAMGLGKMGAEVGRDPVSTVEQANVILLMLEDGGVVENVLFESGASLTLREGTTVIDMSSIAPASALDHSQRLASGGIEYLDAPVSGGTLGAKLGELAILVGGNEVTYRRTLPLLRVFGNPTHIGPVGAGQSAKLVNQVIVAVSIGALAEGLTLAQRVGLDLGVLLKSLQSGFADSRILREHGQRILEGNFASGGSIRVQEKDLRNAIQAARDLNLELPITSLVQHEYAELQDNGWSELDHSALWLWYQES